jgi:D-beta-D-heptose 7-phosphate kinase/D-beta-D-heptose 1-phosphate adenosyltransferase
MDQERIEPISEEEEMSVVDTLKSCIDGYSIVAISDYAKGFLTDTLLSGVIDICRKAGKPVFVDPKGSSCAKYSGATLIKPNRKELEAISGETFDPSSPGFTERIVEAMRKILRANDISCAVVTLSEKGMVFVPRSESEKPAYLPTEGREVFDVSGAGDTTMAVLAAAVASGASMPEAMELANLAAGIVVGKVGTSSVTPEELSAAIGRKHGEMPFSSKVVSVPALKRMVEAWRNCGEKVGFTNGCFDCLHSGHLYSLHQAKAHCDRLVVAVNSDDSVRRLKGPDRPINAENDRALQLASLCFVSYVILFEEDTPEELIHIVKPDILVKGGDYELDEIVGADFVLKRGGLVETIPFVDGYSTTNMIEKIGRDFHESH